MKRGVGVLFLSVVFGFIGAMSGDMIWAWAIDKHSFFIMLFSDLVIFKVGVLIVIVLAAVGAYTLI